MKLLIVTDPDGNKLAIPKASIMYFEEAESTSVNEGLNIKTTIYLNDDDFTDLDVLEDFEAVVLKFNSSM
jgi:hypothetical protein